MWHGTGRTARLVGISLALVLVAFWPTAISMHEVWTRYTYTHGYLIPPLVAWLAWRRRHALFQASEGAGEALIAGGVLGLGWFVALVANVQVIHQGLLPLILLAWVGAFAGWVAVRRVLPAAVVFLFAVPFWEVLTRPLQLVTIAVNGALVRAMGIPAEITGEYVVLSSGVFEIAHSCSGLNFFIIGLLLGVLYAHLFLTRWSTRIKAIAVVVALAIVANWIRVTGLVVIGHATEMQWRYLEDHGTYGWIIFAVAIALFFPAAEWLRKREEASVEASDPVVTEREIPVLLPLRSSFQTRMALATAVVILVPVAWLGFRIAPEAAMAAPVEPVGGEGWTRSPATNPPLRGWEPSFPPPDERIEATWTDGSTAIHQLVYQYDSQEQGRELIGSGNRIASGRALALDRVLWVPVKDAWVREAFVRTEEGPVVIWYWYRVGGIRAVSSIKAKALEVLAFVRRRPRAALVTFSVACLSEQCQDEREVLRGFVR